MWPTGRNAGATCGKTLLQARAIENQCYCIGVNRVGDDATAFIQRRQHGHNPLGEVIYHKVHEEDSYTITLHKEELDKSGRKCLPEDADPL
jgi:predicted amidohydrolase